MSDMDKCSRESYWEEKTTEQRVDKLAEVVEGLARRVLELEKENAELSQHQHDQNGKLVVQIIRNRPEFPWYYTHILGRNPK